jgi:hypothetical protein
MIELATFQEFVQHAMRVKHVFNAHEHPIVLQGGEAFRGLAILPCVKFLECIWHPESDVSLELMKLMAGEAGL